MNLKRNSKLVRWAYLLADRGIPKQTDLCTLFWRSVLWTPLKLALPVVIVVGLGFVFWQVAMEAGLIRFLLIWASVIGVLVLVGGALIGVTKGMMAARKSAKAKGYCPTIDLTLE